MRDTIFIQGQPNGATIENCVQVWPGKAGWLDAQCRYKKWVFCYLPEIPVFAARGKFYHYFSLVFKYFSSLVLAGMQMIQPLTHRIVLTQVMWQEVSSLDLPAAGLDKIMLLRFGGWVS